MQSMVNPRSLVRVRLAAAAAAGLMSAAASQAGVLFDNVTPAEAGTTGAKQVYTSSAGDEYEGNGLNLATGAVDLNGFDLQIYNKSGNAYEYIKINIYVWGAVNASPYTSSNPAFSDELASYSLVANYTGTGLTGGLPSGYTSTFEGATKGVTPGITLNGIPLYIPSSTVGITYNFQGSNDDVTFVNAPALTTLDEYGVTQAVGTTVKENDFDLANDGETNGNFISGPYLFSGYNYTSPFMRVYGDVLSATPDNWLNPAGGTWTDTTQWSKAAIPTGGDTAVFNLNASSNYTVSIPGVDYANNIAVQQDNVTFDIAAVNAFLYVGHALTVGQPATSGTAIAGSLTLTNSLNNQTNIAEAGSIAVGGNGGTGTLTVSQSVYLYSINDTAIAAGSSLVVGFGGKLGTNTLTIAGSTSAWTGTLDIGSSALNIRSGNIATVMNQLHSGFNGGSWTGTGIISSAAAADTTHLTAVGAILNTDNNGNQIYGSGTTLGLFDGDNPAKTAVLLRYTYYGDANLDGQVDGSDYTLIDNGFSNHLTGWYNGDFNYDGVVDGSDYTLIDNAFNNQGSSLGVSNDVISVGFGTSSGVTAADVTAFNNKSLDDATINGVPTVAPIGSGVTDADAGNSGLNASSTAQIASSSVPEPASFGLVAVGALAAVKRRVRRLKNV